MTETQLSDLIRHALENWKEPDPHVIARRLLGKLTSEDRDKLVLAALTDRVRYLVRNERHDTVAADGQPITTARTVGRSRWQRFSQRVCVAGEWKLLVNCTIMDVEQLAIDSEALAKRNMEWAERWRGLAAQMRAHNAKIVGDLPPSEFESLAA